MIFVNFEIEKSTGEDSQFIDSMIVEYSSKNVPFTQDKPFAGINRVIKDSKGNILAGIIALSYYWGCIYVDVLWVSEASRGKGYGTALLIEVEEEGRKMGCSLIHLDTFDFQGREFYLKMGYEVYGVLEDCPPEHSRFYMKKKL